MKNKILLKSEILDLLPHTQCQKCGWKTCAEFAEALTIDKSSINDCPPGGEELRKNLAATLEKPLEPTVLYGAQESTTAHIDESNCIGCTKCLPVCPMDAIIGAKNRTHTVIIDWCTGCDLCALVCPTDCISFMERPVSTNPLPKEKIAMRFFDKNVRLERLKKKEEKEIVFVDVGDMSQESLLADLSLILSKNNST